jgi:hypothetical protein
MVLFSAVPRVVHDAEVNQRAHAATAKNVLGAFATEIDLVMLDISRTVREWAPIEADHARLPMQHPCQASPEPAADPSNDDRAIVFCVSG